jgi:outer membrane protein assembly factor BamB
MEKKTASAIMLALLVVCVIDSATVGFVAHADDSEGESIDWWFMFRHDENHTGYSTSNVSTPIVSYKNLTTSGEVRSSPAVVNDVVFVGALDGYVYRWDVATWTKKNSTRFGPIFSSPAVVDGVVYIGSNDSYVYALNAVDLAMIRNFTTGGAVRSSPVVVEGIVYAGSFDGYFYAWNTSTGKELWKFWTASPIESSPAVSGDTIVFGANDGRIYALERISGRIRWYHETNGAVISSPAVEGDIVFVGSNDTNVYALDATTGKPIWNYSTGGNVTSSPAVAHGMVFVGSDNGYVYALDITTGWSIKNYTTGGPVGSSPTVTADGMVFVGSCDKKIYAFNASTGEQIWNNGTEGPVYSSPAIAKGMVFVGSDDHKVYVFATENKLPVASFTHDPDKPIIYHTATFDASASFDPDGNTIWYSWNFGDNKTDSGKIMTHVYETAGTYIVTLTATDDGEPKATNSTSQSITVLEAWPMFRHDPKHWGNSTSLAPVTNKVLWNQTIGPDVSGDPLMYPSPAVVNGVVYIGSTNDTEGRVYALNATDDGAVIWNYTLGGHIHSSPAVADGMVFIGSDDLNVYALNATNGNLVWKYTATGQVISSPVVAYNKVFISSRAGWLYALPETDPNGNGIIDPNEVKWKYRHPEGGEVESSPAVADGMVFFGSLDDKIYALLDDPNGNGVIDSNEVKWINQTGGRVYSSPTVAYEKVFVGSDDGCVYAFDKTNGNIEWKVQIGTSIKSSPAVADGMVFVGSDDGNLYALNATTNDPNGEIIWKTPKPLGSVRWSSPAVAEGKVFIGTTDGRVYALRLKDGEIWWSYQTATRSPIDSSPAVLNDTLYVASKDGKLYAFWEQVHDIAVTTVSSQPRVAQNQTLDIAVSVENQGSFNETDINVTAQYDDNLFNSTSINLTRGEERLLIIPWNTTSVPEGNYTIYVNATLAPPITDNDTADNTKYVNITVEIGVHDINVTDVKPSSARAPGPIIILKDIVGQGYTVTIYVTVKNEGNYTEKNINVTAYWSNSTHTNQTIGSIIIPELLIKTSVTVSITWSTSGIAKGNYTVSAVADTVPGETDTADNTFVNGVVKVAIAGDINGDGHVNVLDAILLGSVFGSAPGEPAWSANADINGDGYVNILDAIILGNHFDEKEP